MADRTRSVPALRIQDTTEIGAVSPGLTASARVMTGPNGMSTITRKDWQREAWDYWRAEGEFWYGTEWRASAISRIRLVAGVVKPGASEPEILEDGPVAEQVSRLAGGPGGHAAMLKSLSIKLGVPGEGFVYGSTVNGQEKWLVLSSDEVRPIRNTDRTERQMLDARQRGQRMSERPRYEIQIEENVWMPTAPDSMLVRIWDPDEQFHWRAFSPAQPSLPILRRIDLYNRRIIADLTSRLASNGILIMPEEVTFPANPAYADQADPFVAEFIDIASRAIANPGSAVAAIPIPMKVPSAYAEAFRHLTFAQAFDPKLIEARTNELERLASTMNIPREVMLGVGSTNHWNAASIEEAAIKVHIAPTMELICSGFTTGFLHPALEAMGETPSEGERYVLWYDATELTSRSDLTASADAAYDRLEISPSAYRREKGFSEEDAPSDEEMKDMALKVMIAKGNNVEAVAELTGVDIAPEPPPAPVVVAPAQGNANGAGKPTGTPGTLPPGQRQAPVQKTAAPTANAGRVTA